MMKHVTIISACAFNCKNTFQSWVEYSIVRSLLEITEKLAALIMFGQLGSIPRASAVSAVEPVCHGCGCLMLMLDDWMIIVTRKMPKSNFKTPPS